MNLVTKESKASLDITRFLLRKNEDAQRTLLFHGTDHESAIRSVDILDGRGIYLWSGRQDRNLRLVKGFYLTTSVDDAM